MNRFGIICKKCKSENCHIFIGQDHVGGSGGCGTCGYGGECDLEINITVKCGSCGEAMIILHKGGRE